MHALEALNIPVEVSGAGPSATLASTELTVLLRAGRSQDPLSLIAVLRGPLFGISDPGFSTSSSAGWLACFQIPMRRVSPTVCLLCAGSRALNQHYRWTRVPAAGALERVLEDSGYLALAAATPGECGRRGCGPRRRSRATSRGNGGSLADAADALEADRESHERGRVVTARAGRTDVVRLMNLHKAKGWRPT